MNESKLNIVLILTTFY